MRILGRELIEDDLARSRPGCRRLLRGCRNGFLIDYQVVLDALYDF